MENNKSLDGAEEKPLDGAEEKPLDEAEEKPLDGAEEKPLDGAEEKPLDGAEEKPLDGAEKKPHLQKNMRVPRIYVESVKVLKKVKAGAGLRDTVFKMKHPNVRGIYSLVCKTIKNEELLESIVQKTGMLTEKFDPILAKILVAELLLGKQELKGESRPVKRTLEFADALKLALKESSLPVNIIEEKKLPRYVRINTLLVSINGTIQRLIDEGWQQEDTPEKYKAFLDCASNLGEMQFMKDFHFDDVLLFHPKSNMHDHALAVNGSLLLQDKASCLPAVLLDPKPDSVVLDMCAAPGMKTSQLANVMNNKGTIFAVDRDPKRFEDMKQLVERNCKKHNCVTMKLADSIHLTSEDCPGVQYILIDPSCSGSGMVSRVDSKKRKSDTQSTRIKNLSQFQERLLVQAMTAFPDVERIVYSTCSIYEEENENVLARALDRVPSFQVVPPRLKKPWKHRGNPKYPFGSRCLVSNLKTDQTNGFFVAVLERIHGIGHSSKIKLEKRKSEAMNETKGTEMWNFAENKKKAKKKINKKSKLNKMVKRQPGII